MTSTKELAWKLGLLRKRSSSTKDQGLKRIKKTCQEFAFLIVIDFESTCWEVKSSRPRTQEIIEFPAVLLNTSSGEIMSEFQYYVQPQEDPMLSAFCKELTGITQEQVDQGIPLAMVIKRFTAWLSALVTEHGITYNPLSPSGQKCTFVTWSDWDLAVCLQYETRRKQIRKPSELNSWIDLRATYRKFYQRRPQGLNGALQDLGIKFEGREHSGVCDARNTAKLAWRMMTDGCILKITKSLNTATGVKIPKSVEQNRANPKKTASSISSSDGQAPIAVVFTSVKATISTSTKDASMSRVIKSDNDASSFTGGKNFPVNKVNFKSSRNNNINSSVHKDAIINTVSSDKNSSGNVVPKFKIFTDKQKEGDLPEGNTMLMSKNSSTARISAMSFNIPVSNCPKRTVSKIGPLTPSTNDIENRDPKSSMDKIGQVNGTYIGNSFSKTTLNATVSCISKQFKTPQDVSLFSNRKPLGNFNSFYTPSDRNTSKIPGGSMHKRTPPFCECGRRSHRKFVQSPGPNQGRAFFACPNGRSTVNTRKLSMVGQGRQNGCRFFKWEVFDLNSTTTSPFCTSGNQHNRTSSLEKSSFFKKPLAQPDFNITSPNNCRI